MRLATALQKEVIFYMDKKPIEEVAKITGLTLGVVESVWVVERRRRVRVVESVTLMECVVPRR